jgi:DHHC palmitoyltransferase
MAGRKEWCGYGTSFTAQRWLTLDPCGLLGVSCSFGIHFYALLVLVYKVVLFSTTTDIYRSESDDETATAAIQDSTIDSTTTPTDVWLVILSTLLFYALYGPATILALVSLFRATTTDPGAVPMGARPFVRVTRLPDGSSSVSSQSSHGSDVNVPLTLSSSSSPSPLPHRRNTTAQSIRRCHKCGDNFKPPRAHHDSVSGRCIVKFDHYCPWINNSVGALNHKLFCLFLLYTAVACATTWLLIGVRLWHCSRHFAGTVHNDSESSSSSIPQNRFLAASNAYTNPHDVLKHFPAALFPDECRDLVSDPWVRTLALASVLFLVFTTVMGCEQIEAIRSGRGKIARLQQSVGRNGTELASVTSEFNEMFGGTSPHVAWHWFVPTPVQFVPRGMKSVVLGYEFNETCLSVPYQEDEAAYSLDEAECGSVPTEDALASTTTTTVEAAIALGALSMDSPPLYDNETDLLVRDGADLGSVKNRRANARSSSSDDFDDGITLVERTKTRLS